MKKARVIPVLLLRNGWLVQTRQFRRYQHLGNPVTAVERLSEWAADELIYLDITQDDGYDTGRSDLGHPNRQSFFEIIDDVSRAALMPITVGGRIRSLRDIENRLARGADKVCINTKALAEPVFIEQAAKEFGTQCLVLSIDVKVTGAHRCVMAEGGTRATEWEPEQWACEVERLGAGEIFLNAIDRDGMKTGYDLDLLATVSTAVTIPVIACGGVGDWAHFAEALERTRVDAVAAANIFHYSDQSVVLAKRYLCERGLNIRPPDVLTGFLAA